MKKILAVLLFTSVMFADVVGQNHYATKTATTNYTNASIAILGAKATISGNVGITINTQRLLIGTSNNTIFSGNGFMIATGSAMAWDDVAYMQVVPIKDTGVGSLTLTTITGNIQGWAFQVGDNIPISCEFSHKWKIGTPVSIHVHAMNKSVNAADRFMKFQIEFAWADINGVVTSPQILSNNFTVPANATMNTVFYIELGGVTPPVSLVSAHLVGKLSRETATGTAVASDPIVLSFGVHGQVDSLGSRSEYVK